MIVKLLNGNETRIRLSNKHLRGKSKSKFQHDIGKQLAEQYPHDRIYEEVVVGGENFVLDFFIPSIKMVVECHGRQHVYHTRHFHKTVQDFHRQQDTDQRKRDWCELNGFRLVEIYHE